MKHKICICTPIKDEHEYLEEWINHHLSLGIDDIYLFEDFGSKSHLSIVNKYKNVHLDSIENVLNSDFYKNVIFIKKGSWRQKYLYNFFFNFYKKKYDWILMIDIDEFLFLEVPLQKLLNNFKNEKSLKFKWHLMNANGHIKKPKGNVVDNYKQISNKILDKGGDYKSIINCNNNNDILWEIENHILKDSIIPIDEKGIMLGHINHYFTKSWEDYVFKIKVRGDLIENNRDLNCFFYLNEDLKYKKAELLNEITKVYK